MPKPPTAERGRRLPTVTTPPVPVRRTLFSRRGAKRPASPVVESEPGTEISARMVIVLLASVAGLGVATYLTLAHYTTAIALSCPNTGAISCEAVTTSAESVVFGIPVAVLGLPFFVAMLVLALPRVWRSTNRLVAPARLAFATAGIGFVCYLLYAELYEIGKICLWCTSVHVLTLVIFVAVVTGWNETASYAQADELS